MDLIERYLHEVGRYLPRKKRADVLAELRSLIMDSLDARAEGEPSVDTVITVLQEFGPPREVAASYAPAQQYIIGPTLYPTFLTVLKIGLVGLIVVQVMVVAFGLARGGDPLAALSGLLGSIVQSAISFTGAAMIIFAILERLEVQPERKPAEWDPRSLPKLPRGEEVNRAEMAAEVAFTLIALGVVNLYGDRLAGLIDPARPNLFLLSDPAVLPYVVAGSLLLTLDAGLSLYLLYRGTWQLVTRALKTSLSVLWIVLLGQVASLDWSAILARVWGADGLAPLGLMVRGAIYFVMLMVVIDTGKQVYRLVRSELGRSFGRGGSAGSVPASRLG